MNPVRRVLETSLYCDDPARAAAFYRGVLGCQTLYEDTRLIALDAGGGSVLLLFRRGASAAGVDTRGGRIPPHDGAGPQHVAFAIGADDLPAWMARLEAHQLAPESRVRWPRGGESLYLRDPEGHSVELATPGVWAVY
jgi:catechol 2,3-dioxygenase-like lactoylglutathione lyase family enzyme